MAEKPTTEGPQRYDTGGGAAVASQVSAGGNNRWTADVKPLQELNTALTQINTNINKLKTDLPKVISLTEQWASKMRMVSQAMGGMGGGGAGGGGYIKDAGTLTQQNLGGGGGLPMFNFGNISYNVNRSQNLTMGGGGGGGYGGGTGSAGGAGGTAGAIAGALKDALGPMMQALNQRINTNSQYSLSANRMDMLLQQTTGLSRAGVYSNMRQPLQQYKLGAGGLNSVLQLQATKGINAGMQAQSAEALRVATGYGYTTDQINAMTQALASPESANRMFMMMGGGLRTIGGGQRSTMDVVKQTVRRLGLTTESALQGAMAQGSMTRERLRQSGLPEDMQDMVLQYAQSNLQYKKRGGAGMYNPSAKSDRQRMGVENAYANQFEETERTRVNREENMYNRQADNYAKMEEQMQKVVRGLQNLDNALASITGAKIRNRGFGAVAGGVLRGIAPVAGIAAGAIGTPAVGMAVAGGLSALGTLIGEPTGEKDSSVKPGGSAGNIAKSQKQLNGVHPKMRERLMNMMKDNPRLYIGSAVRSSKEQKDLFLSRYEQTNEKTDIFWQGKYWKRVRGVPAAPPGMSMHEIGLAVDLAPSSEFEWIKKNAAKYGLRSFFNVNNEPWHVQPAELPASRLSYEKAGAPWGHNGNVVEPTDTKAIIPNIDGMMHQPSPSAGGTDVNIAIQKYAGMSMNDAIEAMGAGMGTVSNPNSTNGRVSKMSTGSLSSAYKNPSASDTKRGPMNGVELARLLYQTGFRGQNLVKALAIASRESRFNPRALNNNPDTGDLSYGLFQINMKGAMGPKRRRDYNLKSNEDLYDPAINAKVAYALSGGGKNFQHWGGYKGKSDTYNTNMKQAQGYIKQAGLTGDPMPESMPSRVSSGGGLTIQGDSGNNYQVTISPTIQLHGGANYHADVQRMAKDVASLLDREIRMTLLRST